MMNVFIGPCVLEDQALVMEIAEQLIQDLAPFRNEINLVFKGSFDKANRTSGASFRGPGIDAGLKMLGDVKDKFQLPVVTDFHLPTQAEQVAEVVDYLQVPAFLCRQTDLIEAGAKACKDRGRVLKIKKGQFLAPHDCGNIVEKAAQFLPRERILLTERGVSFGYNNLIVDMASFQEMKNFGVKTVYDATHSVQRPGGLGNATGGKREQIRVLAKAAVAAGADGVFIETHPRPEKALSDSATAYPLGEIKHLLAELLAIKGVLS